ncbi:hypothetical protein GCM10025857_24160 [Alicyclobacillus contaminans]|uniref:response regulator n=1 Tax=Alicyclobacillus contaminans TaxID=392016 RepID=UPI0003FA7ED1|nr:response regulator transcription factor [Alicyclobacillus contaminans]GMA51059.1 hypothetical protein GCM10025857_24160 [Alicyclobacillus contaminans]
MPAIQSVLIVEDHPGTAFGLRMLLEQMNAAANIQVVDNGPAALEQLRNSQPDMVIVDLHLPGMDGIKVASEIRAMDDDVHIVVYTGTTDIESSLASLLEIGISGFITKSMPLQRVQRAIECILDGETVVPITLFRRMRLQPTTDISEFRAIDWTMIRLLAEGKSNAEMAQQLFISVKTVENRLTNLYRKLNVTSRLEAVQKCRALNLIE